METDPTIVQFVCFKTQLEQLDFIKTWQPFASSFINQGLRTIVLSSNQQKSADYKFISRNLWSESAYTRASQTGRIGDGASETVKAFQAGIFRTSDTNSLVRAQPNHDKIMMLLSCENTELVTTWLKNFAGQTRVYQKAHPQDQQRFGLIAEILIPIGDGLAIAQKLNQTFENNTAIIQYSICVYQEVLTLP